MRCLLSIFALLSIALLFSSCSEKKSVNQDNVVNTSIGESNLKISAHNAVQGLHTIANLSENQLDQVIKQAESFDFEGGSNKQLYAQMLNFHYKIFDASILNENQKRLFLEDRASTIVANLDNYAGLSADQKKEIEELRLKLDFSKSNSSEAKAMLANFRNNILENILSIEL